MYKMMIVDDQVKEIEAIKEVLDWEQLNIEIVGQAKNGKTGIDEALRLKPDIIITDVVMKGMDGIEMIKYIKSSLPGVKVIFMSCFDDFKFVSQAIEEGAFGYVLKPILPRELLNTIQKILGICQEEKKNLELLLQKQKISASISVLRENFYRNLLFGIFTEEQDILAQSSFLEMDIQNKLYGAAHIELECEEGEKVLFHGVTILERLKQEFGNHEGVCFILSDLSHITVFFSSEDPEAVRVKKNMVLKTQQILDLINDHYNMTATAGLGSVSSRLMEVGASYKQALKALQYKFYMGKLKVIDYEEISFRFNDFDINLENLNDSLKQILFSMERSLVETFVDRYFSPGNSPSTLKYMCYTIINTVQLQLLQMQQSMENVLGPYSRIIEEISGNDSLPELREWMIRNLVKVIEYIQTNNKVENRELARKMEEFIRMNYRRQIILQDVAEHVFLSPSYASYIYKNTYNKTIHQSIEELRLEKALKLLLEEKEVKVFKIAEEAGYSNSSYFINVFKKVYGCTPTEYRKRRIIKA